MCSYTSEKKPVFQQHKTPYKCTGSCSGDGTLLLQVTLLSYAI
jgi:hypothetical protein